MPRIPKVFHFVLGLRDEPEPLHLVHYLCLRSCIEVNQPDEVVLHLGHEPRGRYWDLIRPELTILPAGPAAEVMAHDYDEREVPARLRYAHHSDFVRLDALIEHGGVYADIDTIFVAPIPDELYDESFVLGREAPVPDERTGQLRPSLCNALLMSEPGAPFAVTWRAQMAGALSGWSDHSTLLPHRLSQQHPELVHIEPERTFYPYMWTSEDLHRLFEENDPDLGGACSIHLWSHLWWDKGRTDFSAFHAGLLTEHRIRTIDTTYHRLARPYLPPFDPDAFRPASRPN